MKFLAYLLCSLPGVRPLPTVMLLLCRAPERCSVLSVVSILHFCSILITPSCPCFLSIARPVPVLAQPHLPWSPLPALTAQTLHLLDPDSPWAHSKPAAATFPPLCFSPWADAHSQVIRTHHGGGGRRERGKKKKRAKRKRKMEAKVKRRKKKKERKTDEE